MKRLKFRLKKGKGSVNRFTDEKGVKHYAGDVVDLPARMKGAAWLEPVEAERKVKAKPSKVEAPSEPSTPELNVEPVEVPLEVVKPKKSRKKKA